MINFVIFVVDGLSVLKSMDGNDIEKDYERVITTAFNCPYLSYGGEVIPLIISYNIMFMRVTGRLLSLFIFLRSHSLGCMLYAEKLEFHSF